MRVVEGHLRSFITIFSIIIFKELTIRAYSNKIYPNCQELVLKVVLNVKVLLLAIITVTGMKNFELKYIN